MNTIMSGLDRHDPMLKLLFIDDETILGESVKRILKKTHVVEHFTDARDALEALAGADEGELPGAILCDLTMPNMGGIEFYEELERVRPEMLERVGFISGGASAPHERDFLHDKQDRFVLKPFSVKVLREFVARLSQ